MQLLRKSIFTQPYEGEKNILINQSWCDFKNFCFGW